MRSKDQFINDVQRQTTLRREFAKTVAAFARQHGYDVDSSDLDALSLDLPHQKDTGGDIPKTTTRGMGEEDGKGRASVTTMAMGEEEPRRRGGATTEAVGEEDDKPHMTTLAVGEEDDKPHMTTLAVGEEDDKPVRRPSKLKKPNGPK